MSGTATRTSRRAIAGLATAAMIAASTPVAMARGTDAFRNLAGTWQGTGVVTDAQGQSERIRCNVGYGAVANGLSQNLVCASAAFRFNVTATIYNRGGNITGSWQETTRGYAGAVTGVVRGNQIVTTVSSSGFTAALTIVSNGDMQTVVIQPNGGDIARVSISFRR